MSPWQARPRKLRRQLFTWFAIAILVSTAFGVGLGALFGLLNGRHEHHEHPIERFVASRVADEWTNVDERRTILVDAAEHLTFGVELRDASGKVLETYGATCPHVFTTETVSDHAGLALGELAFCVPRMGPSAGPSAQGPSERSPRRFATRIIVIVLLSLTAMWAASGRVARMLASPLQDLARVADDLGHGNLGSRAALSNRHHSVEELDSLARSINDMAERIERQLHDQKELLAAVSHELRTPLGHAKLLLEMAKEVPNPPKQLDELELEFAELDRMVGQLLASARLDFTALEQKPLDPVQLAVRVLERAGVDAARLTVETTTTHVRGDAALLAQALANLVDNARRHAGQLVALRLRTEGQLLWFDVLDNGKGFEDGQETLAFEPFQRGPASHGGLGLGLALVRRIATAHAGQVRAGNRPEGGAIVGLGVPVA